MKQRTWVIIVALLLVINVALMAFMWMNRPQKGRPPQRGPVNEFLKKELSLTAEQEKRFEEERKKHFEALQTTLENIHEKRDAMFDLIPAQDSTNLSVLAAELAQLESQKEVITVQHFRALRRVLNAQQQEKFDDMFRDILRMMSPQGPPPGRGPNGNDEHRPPPPHERERQQ